MKHTTAIKHLAVGVALGLVISFPASAAVGDKMADVFDSLINVTPGQYYEGQRRNSFTAGGIYIRNRVITPQIISFKPPSLDAGCGGIDAFTGSFSFLNAAELEAMFRAIASNALGYAFQLAIDSMCPSCAQLMQSLQKVAQNVNSFMGDSCQAATTLVDMTRLDEWSEANKYKQNSLSVSVGAVNDFFESFNNKVESVAQQANNAGTVTQMTQNVVYQALSEHGVSNWVINGADVTMLDIIMNLTGTVVVSCENSDIAGNCIANAGGEINFVHTPYESTLELKHFMEGTDIEPAGTVDLLTCDPSTPPTPPCLSMTPTATAFVGFKEMVRELLIGDAVNLGIAAKMRLKTIPFTPQQQSLIETAPVPIMAMLQRASVNPGVGETIAEQASDVIAIEIAYSFVEQLVNAARTAVVTRSGPESDIFLQRYQLVLNQLQHQRKEATDHLDGVKNIYTIYESVMTQLVDHISPQVAESLLKTSRVKNQ